LAAAERSRPASIRFSFQNCGKAISSCVRAAIEAADATLVYHPPYSPDFNPTENAFAKLKALLRTLPSTPSKACAAVDSRG
jgi:transposase